jgi:hypothetical protein
MTTSLTPPERALLEALLDLERAAIAPQRPSILPLLQRIDQLASQLPAETPGELRHFLQRKSYQKARLLLEGRNAGIQRGHCAPQ